MLTLLQKTLRAGVVAVAAVAALTAPARAALPAEQWWPLEAGNRWVLRDAASGDVKEVRVDARQGNLAYVIGMLGQDHWYGLSSGAPNSLYVWNDDQGAWQPFSRFGYNTTKWRFDLSSGGCDLFECGWARGSGAVDPGFAATVPAGRFTQCRELQTRLIPAPNVRCRVPVAKIVFAKNVGPVKMVLETGVSYDLETAIVGGTSYPRPSAAAIQGTLSAPKPIWINKPNTIQCIRAPCPSNELTAKVPFSFEVKNNTSQAATLQFASGQHFDIEIVNGAGQVVTAWADGRAFTMALTSRTLQPGQSVTYQGEVELKDRSGRQLDGTFTARARLTTARWATPVIDVSATSQVQVRIQP